MPNTAHTPPDSATALSRRELRARLFWLARWLLGAGSYHRGAIQVAIMDTGSGSGETMVLRPKKEEEMYDAMDGPGEPERLAELALKLLDAMLSPDARVLMRYVAAKAPVVAKGVAAGTGIERSRCYMLLQDLRERGLIRDTGDGYEVAAPEVWAEVLRRG